jgi:RNA polymerase sigma-70 factor (ECF subfamily)
MKELEGQYAADDQQSLFDHLRPFLGGAQPDVGYREIASQLQMAEGTVKVAAHRMRRRYGDLVRQQIAGTVSDPEELDDEIRHLFDAMRA